MMTFLGGSGVQSSDWDLGSKGHPPEFCDDNANNEEERRLRPRLKHVVLTDVNPLLYRTVHGRNKISLGFLTSVRPAAKQ